MSHEKISNPVEIAFLLWHIYIHTQKGQEIHSEKRETKNESSCVNVSHMSHFGRQIGKTNFSTWLCQIISLISRKAQQQCGHTPFVPSNKIELHLSFMYGNLQQFFFCSVFWMLTKSAWWFQNHLDNLRTVHASMPPSIIWIKFITCYDIKFLNNSKTIFLRIIRTILYLNYISCLNCPPMIIICLNFGCILMM